MSLGLVAVVVVAFIAASGGAEVSPYLGTARGGAHTGMARWAEQQDVRNSWRAIAGAWSPSEVMDQA